MQIIAVASGKGGVGKSLIAANLAIALHQSGKRVVLADLDLGGSNLHLILGEAPRSKGLGAFLNDRETQIHHITYPTSWENLRFIPGEAELPGAANMNTAAKRRLMRALANLDTDYLILDLGAGTSFNTLDFFLLSSCGLLVSTPAAASIQNAYLFLKNSVFRILSASINRASPARTYMNDLRKDGVSLQKIRLNTLLGTIRTMDEEAYNTYLSRVAHLHPRLILNLLLKPGEVSRSNKLRVSAREHLGVEMGSLGSIYHDQAQDMAQRSGLPILTYKPHSVLSQAVNRVAAKILKFSDDPIGPLTPSKADESFEETENEAGEDYEVKEAFLQSLLQSKSLTQSELVEAVRIQYREIHSLKQENRYLKKKIVSASGRDTRV